MTSPTYQSVGTNATGIGVGGITVACDAAGLAAGDGLLIVVTQHEENVAFPSPGTAAITCTTAAHGLTKLCEVEGSGATGGTDNGRTRTALFYKTYAGETSFAFTSNTNGGSMGRSIRVTVPAGYTLSVAGVAGEDTVNDASFSAALAAVSFAVDDLCLVHIVKPTDSAAGAAFTAESITAAGITFGAATEIAETSTSVGFDQGGVLFRQTVTAGAATVAPTIAATVALGGGGVRSGTAALARCRATIVAPGVPTALAETPDVYSATLDWGVPATGGAPAGYMVRVDGGASTDVGNVLTHLFTGLDPVTSYTLEVQAYNAGGSSAWVTIGTTTLVEPDVGWYRIELELGSHSWSVEKGDAPAYGPLLPLSMGWEIPDSVDWFPSQAGLTTLRFDVRSTDASELADVVKGTTVAFRMWVDPDPLADPWQELSGVVTQLDGAPVKSATDPELYDFVTNVYAADDNARLADMWVGYTADWPVEHIEERAERIVTEAGLLFDRGTAGGAHGVGMVGWLNTRAGNSPVSVLDALRATLKDAADDYDSEPPFEFYGRYVYQYVPDDGTVYVHVFRRRMFSTFNVTLPGEFVDVAGQWSKRPGPAAAEWVIVDGVALGTPSGVPLTRSTSLYDTTAVPGDPINHSATERDTLAESLLPDGSTALEGWSTRLLVFEASYVAPIPLEDTIRWASFAPPTIPIAVIVTPIRPELELNGVDYIAGTLTGCRLVIPPGGKFKLELKLRNELLAGVDLP